MATGGRFSIEALGRFDVPDVNRAIASRQQTAAADVPFGDDYVNAITVPPAP